MYNDKGLTLIELALVLLLSGVTLALIYSGFVAYRNYQIEVHNFGNFGEGGVEPGALSRIEAGMRRYFSFQRATSGIGGAYPCPADPALPRSHPNFGFSVPRDIDGNCIIPPGMPPPVPAVREIDLNEDGVIQNGSDSDPDYIDIYFGIIPFRTILEAQEVIDPSGLGTRNGMAEKWAFDGWGRPFTYVVSSNMTNPREYDEEGGVIRILSEHSTSGNEISVVTPNNNDYFDPSITEAQKAQLDSIVHYAIISHGENGLGSFELGEVTGTGQAQQFIRDCRAITTEEAADIALGLIPAERYWELDNCDHTNPELVSSLRNKTERFYHDDIIDFWLQTSSLDWAVLPESGAGETRMVNANTGNVGVGVAPPTESLHVRGDMQAMEIQSLRYCDTTGTNCFDPALIGGPRTEQDTSNSLPNANACPTNHAMVAIENNRVVCQEIFPTDVVDVCPLDTYAVGINATTGLICESFP